ncbi:Polysaccharide biosynthesis protein [Aquisphaera giovannonii]|uniref:Polysaccharide biosynthesis protein n=2 Tax=Aquisphaera giovannonii TaxID=406548 RepID=A0A5B9W9H3_9BACT|nr:Polysaccharide biosynthesis protein [Aquisphaera giovannonii]
MAAGRRIASNFAFLSLAELVCRGTSVVVTLSLAQRLGKEGYGRIEFAFNIVFWLVLLIRDSSDVMAARELSRHPRLIKPLVDHVLAIKGLFSLVLFSGLALVGAVSLKDPGDWYVLSLYGLMLFTTASGLDFVYRGTECMGLLAVSLSLRTSIYAIGALAWVKDPSRILWVPIWLAVGEASGIALVWLHYLKTYRMPRPRLGLRFVGLILQRGRTVCLIQLSQAVISTADFLVVGFLSTWSELGLYAAPHRLVTAILTFGLIFQQAAFPTLSRLWRQTACVGRTALDLLVEVQVTVLVPVAVGGTILAEPIVRAFLPSDYDGAGLLLAMGIWRAPLLILAFLYQTALIALNREIAGVRSLVLAAMGIGPLVMVMRLKFGLPGALAAVLLLGLALVAAGFASLAREGRQPAWHHHLARPVAASLAMIPACLLLRGQHIALAVFGGALAYCAVWILLGGLERMRVWRLAFRSLPMRGRSA